METRKNKKAIVAAAVLIALIFLLTCALDAVQNDPGSAAEVYGAARNEGEIARDGKVLRVVTDPEDSYVHDDDTIYEDDDESSVVTMYLTVMRGNRDDNTDHAWTEINTYSADWYEERGLDRYKVEGILQEGDEDGPAEGAFGYGEAASNCTVQVRGQTSTRAPVKNYKIRIKDGKGNWRGQRTIALNRHRMDRVRFVNKMTYDLMKQIPQLISARTQFVHLYVKDLTDGDWDADFEDAGLYTQVEQMNRTYLENHGLDRNGHLYKVTFFEWYRLDAITAWEDPEQYDEREFEKLLEIKGSRNHDKLLAALDEVSDYSIPIEKIVEEHFDVDNLCYWIAFHILTGNYDTGSRNLYLYSPLNSRKWYIISWDNDSAFRRNYFRYITDRLPDGAYWERGMSQFCGIRLFNRMLKQEIYREALKNAVEDLRSHYLTDDVLSSMAARNSSTVKPILMNGPDADIMRITWDEYDFLAANLPGEVEENYRYFLESAEDPWPFFVDVPRVEDGELLLQWESSYDIRDEELTYYYSISTDPHGEEILLEGSSQIPMASVRKLEPGTYYLHLNVRNASGKSQVCYDYFTVEGEGKAYGTLCFIIREDDTIERIERSEEFA